MKESISGLGYATAIAQHRHSFAWSQCCEMSSYDRPGALAEANGKQPARCQKAKWL